MKKTIIAIIIGIGLIGDKGKLMFKKKKSDNEQIGLQYKEHSPTDRASHFISPQDASKEDRAKLLQAYSEESVKKKALVDKAAQNIAALTINEHEHTLIEYRQDLLNNAYNNYLI